MGGLKIMLFNFTAVTHLAVTAVVCYEGGKDHTVFSQIGEQQPFFQGYIHFWTHDWAVPLFG